MHSAYCGHLVESVINKKPRKRAMQRYSDNKRVYMVSILNVKDQRVSKKFKIISERYNIRTVFKTTYTLGGFFEKNEAKQRQIRQITCFHLKMKADCF